MPNYHTAFHKHSAETASGIVKSMLDIYNSRGKTVSLQKWWKYTQNICSQQYNRNDIPECPASLDSPDAEGKCQMLLQILVEERGIYIGKMSKRFLEVRSR